MSFIYTRITNTRIVHCISLSKKNVRWWHLKFHKRHSLSDLYQISTQPAPPFFFHPVWLHRDSPHSAGVWWWRPGQWRQRKGVGQLVITEKPWNKVSPSLWEMIGRWDRGIAFFYFCPTCNTFTVFKSALWISHTDKRTQPQQRHKTIQTLSSKSKTGGGGDDNVK